MTLPHSALAPSGQPIWLDMARRSAAAVAQLQTKRIHTRHILTDAALRNAMTVHAAFGGSTNLLLHIPAIAYHAGLRRPTVEDWTAVNRRVPRLVDALPNGPVGHPTVRVFLAGGVPEVMLHLRRLGLLELDCLTVTGEPLGEVLDWWESPNGARCLREVLRRNDGIDPDEVIMDPEQGSARGPHLDGDFSSGQPRSGRLGHQEHGHRSERGRRRRRLSQGRPGPRLHDAKRPPSPRSRASATLAFSPAMCSC